MADDMREVWQSQPVEGISISLEEIRDLSQRWERRIHWRNAREYLGGIAAAAVFAASLWRARGWHRLPPAMLIAGLAFVLWQVHRRGAAGTPPAGAGLLDSIVFYRRELERQRDALSSVWKWYLLPITPGLAATWLDAVSPRGFGVLAAAMLGVIAVLWYVIWDANRRVALRLGQRVEELKAMEERHE